MFGCQQTPSGVVSLRLDLGVGSTRPPATPSDVVVLRPTFVSVDHVPSARTEVVVHVSLPRRGSVLHDEVSPPSLTLATVTR